MPKKSLIAPKVCWIAELTRDEIGKLHLLIHSRHPEELGCQVKEVAHLYRGNKELVILGPLKPQNFRANYMTCP